MRRLLNARTGHELATLPHQDGVSAVAFSPDGTLLATGSGSPLKSIPVWRRLLRSLHRPRGGPGETRGQRVGNSRSALTAHWSRRNRDTGRVFEARSGRQLATLTSSLRHCAIAFSPDGMRIATASDNKTAARVRGTHGTRSC